MKLVYKLNTIFLAVVILLVPMVNLVAAGCHSHSHADLSYDAGNAKNSSPGVITSTDSHHCHPDATPEKETSGDHQCCNNHTPTTGLLSPTNLQANLQSNFFCSPEKVIPALGVYSTPYIPPQNI